MQYFSHMNILKTKNTSCFNQLNTLFNKVEARLVEKCCKTNKFLPTFLTHCKTY